MGRQSSGAMHRAAGSGRAEDQRTQGTRAPARPGTSRPRRRGSGHLHSRGPATQQDRQRAPAGRGPADPREHYYHYIRTTAVGDSFYFSAPLSHGVDPEVIAFRSDPVCNHRHSSEVPLRGLGVKECKRSLLRAESLPLAWQVSVLGDTAVAQSVKVWSICFLCAKNAAAY